jgi:hypothetical protein
VKLKSGHPSCATLANDIVNNTHKRIYIVEPREGGQNRPQKKQATVNVYTMDTKHTLTNKSTVDYEHDTPFARGQDRIAGGLMFVPLFKYDTEAEI